MGMRRLFVFFILFFLLTACGRNIPQVASTPGVLLATDTGILLPTVSLPTLTLIPATPTSSPSSTRTPTAVPCDPLAQYCIEAGHFVLDRPIAPPGMDRIDPGYPYGSTEGGTRDPHHGVEFYNGTGTPVLAAADGRVVVAGNDSHVLIGPRLNFYGNVIVLEHSFPGISQPVFSLYGHLSKILVQTGQNVRSGDEIGEVGATGEAIGSHLHFEVRESQDDYSSNRNPVLWLKPLSGVGGQPFGLLAGRVMDASGSNLFVTNINIQYFQDDSQTQTSASQVDSYAPESQPVNGDDLLNENFSLADLQSGNYRVSLYYDGKFYDRWVIVQPGKLTYLIFSVDK